VELAVGLDAPARARRWIGSVCERFELDHLRTEATLLVDELVTNAVLHARTDCVVVVEKGDDALRVEVIDHNGDVVGVQPGAERLSTQGGRGLVIVAAMATAWGVHEHPLGKSVWFTLPTAGSGHAEPTATPTSRMVRS
jgi:anti-sigma regulatory factor (Ser/Thr protein kinase)